MASYGGSEDQDLNTCISISDRYPAKFRPDIGIYIKR